MLTGRSCSSVQRWGSAVLFYGFLNPVDVGPNLLQITSLYRQLLLQRPYVRYRSRALLPGMPSEAQQSEGPTTNTVQSSQVSASS
jgi:hypothetical protein